MRRYPFIQLDVFTRRALEGNQLAVFTDATGLAEGEMQALAREMNLSETTFVLPRDNATEQREGMRVRIFTVEEELDFAGHPTLGTAFAMRPRAGVDGNGVVNLALRVGKIPVSFEAADGAVFGEMRQRDPEFRQVHAIEDVAQAIGLDAHEISSEWPIQTVSTGLPFTIVPLRRLETLQKLQFDFARARPYLERTSGRFFYLLCADRAAQRARARMIFYNGEDPATGSAAGCAASWMVRHGVFQPDTRVLIEQGVEMKRPSQLHVRASLDGDRVTNVRVGGYCVEVLRGEVTL
jgi:trans-2,3-dihydro-3-hydroxyanthranilate isomerase